MATGTVKRFEATNGFGFIGPASGGRGVFVDLSAPERAVLAGFAAAQKVTCEVDDGRDGRESATCLALA